MKETNMNIRPFFAATSIVTLGLFSQACGRTTADVENGAGGDVTNEMDSEADVAEQLSAMSIGVASFAALGNAAVTCTGGTIMGNVGTNLAPPEGAVTACAPAPGTVHVGDAAAKAAFANFLVRYDALAPKPTTRCTVLTGTLAGITLPPGNYCFTAAATLTGILTLQGLPTDKWLFRIGTGGTGALTGTSFQVVMSGGAKPCNVRWWISQAMTMTTSAFQGKVFAGAAITLTGGSMNGNAWAKADITNTGAAIAGCPL
jgi:hypothetical protein